MITGAGVGVELFPKLVNRDTVADSQPETAKFGAPLSMIAGPGAVIRSSHGMCSAPGTD